MRKTRVFSSALAACAVLAGCSGDDASDSQSRVEAADSVFSPDVRQELVQLGTEDQEPRQELTPERMQDTLFAQSMLRGDSARTARLRDIVREYGWPDSVRAGPEAAQAAFLILQHSPDDEFQREMLPVIEDLAQQGTVPRDDAAMLIDRVLMRQDLPQRYGTQFTMEEGRFILHPVEDEAGLEGRREMMGLPAMEEYMQMMEEFYQAPVERQP